MNEWLREHLSEPQHFYICLNEGDPIIYPRYEVRQVDVCTGEKEEEEVEFHVADGEISDAVRKGIEIGFEAQKED